MRGCRHIQGRMSSNLPPINKLVPLFTSTDNRDPKGVSWKDSRVQLTKRKSGLKIIIIIINATKFCERICYFFNRTYGHSHKIILILL